MQRLDDVSDSQDSGHLRRETVNDLEERNRRDIAPENPGIIGRLCQCCIQLFSNLLSKRLDNGMLSDHYWRSLQRRLDALLLWADGHDVLNGSLDHGLQESRRIRVTLLECLRRVLVILAYRNIDWNISGGTAADVGLGLSTAILSRSNERSALLYNGKVRIVLVETDEEISALKRVERDHSDKTSDESSDESSDDEDGERESLNPTTEVSPIIGDLKRYTECLIDLDSTLRWPAKDPAAPRLTSRLPHEYFAEPIRIRYPKAADALVQRLGKGNWERFLRCQEARELNEAPAGSRIDQIDEPDLSEESTWEPIWELSSFHDSGIGSSAQVSNAYEPILLSTARTSACGLVGAFPPLPKEGMAGLPFRCLCCSRMVQIDAHRVWRYVSLFARLASTHI